MTNKKAKTNKKTETKKADKVSYVVAKDKDGTIQITFTIPFKDIKKSREIAAKDIRKNM